jgi:outer membrane immunogenic protein
MGIKSLINNFASAALMLSFCGAVSISALAQDRNGPKALLTNSDTKLVAKNPFDKIGTYDKTAADTSASKKQSSSSNSWTGFYFGGYLGGTWGRASANTSTIDPPAAYFASTSPAAINSAGAQRIKPKAFAGGGTVGYNYQFGNYFVGGEADFGSMDLNKTIFSAATYPCCTSSSFTISQNIKTDWLFTARPRAGFMYGKALLYGTGGLAMTNLKYGSVFTDTFATASETGGFDKTRVGWTAGAGMEYAVAKHWSVKGEYLFADFGRASSTSTNLFTSGSAYPNQVFTNSTDLKTHNLRFGINYRF